ncbi:MAG: terminase large subunit domain-containing protein [Candidatus Thorarchaeota archaeon]|jgi:replicative DNA helicase
MSPIDLKQCTQTCHQCVKDYIKRFQLKKGDSFDIPCTGIPLQYLPDSVIASLGEEPEAAIAMLDPVAWANRFLDWHCTDPDGEIWKRKTNEGSLPPNAAPYDEERARRGKSIFNRPYQEKMLQCSSIHKVFRIGRQAGKSEVLCIVTLHAAWTHEKFKVVIITPYQAQIDMIFGRLTDMIQSNPLLSNSVSRNVKAPNYQIRFHNGSQVMGFTAGTRSGQEAGASRGQPANMLVFDEADYLAPGDVNAALATIANFPGATVWMSSTPTGKRERFYATCNNKLYREFYYPSQINPNWTEDQDAFFRSEFTEEGYNHEILAEFGQQEEGVYQIKYVEAAQSDYEYGDMKPYTNFVYMLGVDWNDQKVGTTIAVVGYNSMDGCFYLVDKATVSRGNWTQLAACHKVAEMNRLWRPDFIYVDKGFGATQIEVLHKRGYDALRDHGPNHPDARLRDIVKGYDFGGSVEIRDLFTQQPIKKPSKPFLVENSVRRFESAHFKYPKSDEKYTAQLLGYIIKRTAMSGRPVYEQQDEKAGDHLLDAVNLALVAFSLEKSQFGKPTYSQTIAVTGRFGEDCDMGRESKSDFKVDKYKPKEGRASQMEKDTRIIMPENGDLPAANTNLGSSVGIWRWPGFGHDAPRPEARSLSEAFHQAEKRVYNRSTRRRRPKRAKF